MARALERDQFQIDYQRVMAGLVPAIYVSDVVRLQDVDAATSVGMTLQIETATLQSQVRLR